MPNKQVHLSPKASVFEVITALDKYFAKAPHRQSLNLWYLLTALRGPDNEDYSAKKASTAILRYIIFPRACQVERMGLWEKGNKEDIKIIDSAQHFNNHILYAKNAIEDEFPKFIYPLARIGMMNE